MADSMVLSDFDEDIAIIVNLENIIFQKFTMIGMDQSKFDNTIESAIVRVRLSRISNIPLHASQNVIFYASGVVTVTTPGDNIHSEVVTVTTVTPGAQKITFCIGSNGVFEILYYIDYC
jgi:hypothetical protein